MKSIKKVLFVLTLLLSFSLVLVSCVEPSDDPVDKAPVITVEPERVEVYAGDEVDLMIGVSANDEVDGEIEVVVSSDGGFDSDTPGTYVITYKAVNSKGKETTATRTIVVLEPLSQLALEVRENKLGEQKWQGVRVNFKNDLYVELDANTTLEKVSGVFHNTASHDITLTVDGSYGVAAILTANGKVVEGRDGANSRLVNEQNPQRASSSVTKFDEETTIAQAFAKDMVIPAGGYAVVIQSNYAGTTADTDGRGFMNYNVIYQYGNVVRLLWVDSNEVITPYVNQAPTVSGNTKVYVAINSAVSINDLVLAGLKITDDAGTFEISDDVEITNVSVTDNGGFDVTKEGEYTFTLVTTDGTLETTFTRVVVVLSADKCTTVKVGQNSHIVLNESVAIDKTLTSVGSYTYLVYTKDYKLPEGESLPANGYGVAFILNEYGEIITIYDGANGRKFTKDHHTVSKDVVDTETCDPKTYLTDAFKEAQEGGYTLLVAPNSTQNNAAGGSRKFLLDNRSYGEKVTITGVTFKTQDLEFSINGKTFTAVEGTYLINEITSKAATFKMLVYTSSFDAAEITCNGFGVAIVLDKYGRLVRIYDGANAKLFDMANPSGIKATTFDGNSYATVAYKELTDGETLIIFPNDGVNAPDSARSFASALRTDGSLGQIATLSGFAFQEEVLVFEVQDKTFKANTGEYAINQVVSDAAKYKMLVYTSSFDATEITCNGFGVAIVLDKYGFLVRIYDGANAKLYNEENPTGTPATTFDAKNFGNVAYAELTDGETLIIFPNDGVNAPDSARSFGLSLRSANYIAKQCKLTDFVFEEKVVKALIINGKQFTKDGDITIAVNDTAAKNNTHNFVVYTSNFVGSLGVVNGYGIAFVIKEGKVVRIYDGANAKYYDADYASGVKDDAKCTANDYLKQAILSLTAGEWVLCAPHDGGANVARGFLSSVKVIGAEVSCNLVDIPEGTKEAVTAVMVNGNYYFNGTIGQNVYSAKPGDFDFLVYAYGYAGRVLKNGWSEGFVVDTTTNQVVRIYDGMNGKYFDAENNGVAAGEFYNNATLSVDAFKALKPNEVLVLGLNGGANGAIARAFLNSNRKVGCSLSFIGTEMVKPATEEVVVKAVSVDGDLYFVKAADVVKNVATSAPFIIYEYGYTGDVLSNAYGVALVIKDGKVVRAYDGANGKYFDADNTSGVVDSTKLTAQTYLTAAVASLTEGEWVLCAPNGGSANNVSRGFLLDHRKIGINVEVPSFE